MVKKLFAFVGPDGSGKTTTLKGVEKILKENNVRVISTRFNTSAYTKSKRFFDLILKFSYVFFQISLGKVVLTDRYMYLTFSDKLRLRDLFLKVLPKPKRTYFLDNDAKAIHNRKKELPLEKLNEQLNLFRGLKLMGGFRIIKTDKSPKEIAKEIRELI